MVSHVSCAVYYAQGANSSLDIFRANQLLIFSDTVKIFHKLRSIAEKKQNLKI